MPSAITDIGRAFIAQEVAALRAVDITTVKLAAPIFADPAAPPVPGAALTDLETPVLHTTLVSGVGKIDPDNVAYSVYLDTTVGDFTITQLGYYADDGAGGLVLVLVSNVPPVYKRANGPGQSGNNYKHTGILQLAGAAVATGITVPPATWQLDMTALLAEKQPLAEKSQPNGYAALDGAGQVPDTQIAPGIQRTAEKGAANGYAALDAGGTVPDSQLAATVQRMTEKGAANGYAGLDGSGIVPDTQLPADLQRTGEKGAANGYAALDGAGQVPDAQIAPGIQRTAEKGVANGYASLGANGLVPGSQLPPVSVDPGTIAQSHLKTATGQVSTAGSTLVNLLLPGGEYGFYPRIGVTGGAPPHIFGEAQIAVAIDLTAQQGSFFTYVSVKAGSSQTNAIVWQRYIQASPPYDLGDGEVPLFVFALVESDGRVRAVYSAPDPPWANNGPTDIRPHLWRDGRPMQRRRKSPRRPKSLTKAALATWLEAVRSPEEEEVEVTPTLKNADMPLIPHPFLGNDLAGCTVVLLDPVADLTRDLAGLHKGGESVNALLHEDWLRVDNAALRRCCPPGVQACAPKWRTTR